MRLRDEASQKEYFNIFTVDGKVDYLYVRQFGIFFSRGYPYHAICQRFSTVIDRRTGRQFCRPCILHLTAPYRDGLQATITRLQKARSPAATGLTILQPLHRPFVEPN
jgi:hypothetical protein